MLRTILISLSLTVSSASYGACQLDSPEIGDIGPGSELVCNMLESRVPNSDIAILDRKIHSPNTVSVIVMMDGKPETLEYKLKRANLDLILYAAIDVCEPEPVLHRLHIAVYSGSPNRASAAVSASS